ncbi:MAG TPA: EI24 domain-containing protein [Alphaproteobacteria bacterium]
MLPILIAALFKAFGQLDDPALRRVMWRGLGLALVLFAVLLGLSWWGLSSLTLVGIGWIDAILAGLGGLAAAAFAVLFFPGAMFAAQCMLLDDAAEAVELRHYPYASTSAPALVVSVWASVRLALVTVVLNLLLLPFYFIPVINLIVFYSLNGYLYGREYFELVALRHMPAEQAKEMRKRHSGGLFLAGFIAAGLFSIPLVGLFMPAVVAAFMVHVFESLRQREEGRSGGTVLAPERLR